MRLRLLRSDDDEKKRNLDLVRTAEIDIRIEEENMVGFFDGGVDPDRKGTQKPKDLESALQNPLRKK